MASDPFDRIVSLVILAGVGIAAWYVLAQQGADPGLISSDPHQEEADQVRHDMQGLGDFPRNNAEAQWHGPTRWEGFDLATSTPPGSRVNFPYGAVVVVNGHRLTFLGYRDSEGLAFWDVDGTGSYGIPWESSPSDFDWSSGAPKKGTNPIGNVARATQDFLSYGITTFSDAVLPPEQAERVRTFTLGNLTSSLRGIAGWLR